jgi:hypothetical protein
MVVSPAGLGPENDGADEDQQQLYMTDKSSRERGCYIRAITTSAHSENKISGRESQGACRQAASIVSLALTVLRCSPAVKIED